MLSPRQVMGRGLFVGLLAAVIGAGAFFLYVTWYAGTDRLFPGVTVGATPVGGLRRGEAERRLAGAGTLRPAVLAGGAGAGGGATVGSTLRPEPPLSRPAVIRVRWGDRVWWLPQLEVGPDPDIPGAVRRAGAIGRSGSLWYRSRLFLMGFVHGHRVPIEPRVRERAIAGRLGAIAREINRAPTDARYDAESDSFTEDAAGQLLDVAASGQAIRQALLAGRPDVELVVRTVAPTVRKQELAHVHQYELARFTTPILSAELGRVQNIAIAVKKIAGTVLQPGQVFSFNDIVGPRDAEHGWAQAYEIYQGEFVLGYGGGICQVSSTLYNSVLLAGLEVKERFHHDRPLQYVPPGRDATVAWQMLDFKFRNSTDMPLMLAARVLPGSPQRIEVVFHAPRPAPVTGIHLEDGEVRYYPPDMVEVPDATLPGNARQVVDEGHYGIELKIFRVFPGGQGERRELVSHDRYQPKAGKVRVGVGNAPGSQKLLNPGLQ